MLLQYFLFSLFFCKLPTCFLILLIVYGEKMEPYFEKFRIRAYEVNLKGYLSVASMCNYLQEAAGNHATVLGVGVAQLFKEKLTWVLSRFHLQVDRYPFWGEELMVETWPSVVGTMHAVRDFHLLDKDKNIIARASSSWMMLDLKQRKAIKLPESVVNFHADGSRRALEDNFDQLPAPQNIELENRFAVRYSDLDVNGHVNNVRYIEWASEVIPAEFRKSKQLHRLEIAFRAEANYGDHVLVKGQTDGDKVIHRILRESDSRELAATVQEYR
jgi:medium-chain acyl-[acyl-carrier-protein] hydrolase